MPLHIDDPETERLAQTLAGRTGETITVAIRRALEGRLRRIAIAEEASALLEELAAIRKRVAALPILDRRNSDQILVYDEDGLPR